jgi:hypothetical protein
MPYVPGFSRSLKLGIPDHVYQHFDILRSGIPSDLRLATSILQVSLMFDYRSAYYFAAFMNFFQFTCILIFYQPLLFALILFCVVFKKIRHLEFLGEFLGYHCFHFHIVLWYWYVFPVVLCVVISRLRNWLPITVVLNVMLLIRCGFASYVDTLAVAVTWRATHMSEYSSY